MSDRLVAGEALHAVPGREHGSGNRADGCDLVRGQIGCRDGEEMTLERFLEVLHG